MRISESVIQLNSERTAIERHVKTESLTVWQGDSVPRVTRSDGDRGRRIDPSREIARQERDRVSLSKVGGLKRREIQAIEAEIPDDQERHVELNMRLLRALFEKITGRKFQVVDPSRVKPIEAQEPVLVEGSDSVQAVEQSESEGYGLIYDYRESHYEYESTRFQAAGIIKTEDGREIDFSASLSMSREFYTEQNMNIRAGDALKDPLVINFSGKAAELSQRDFHFDIDADGSEDQISFVGPGSGFLALDKNEDGIINDGRELFGALSGDGFQDLSVYDTDGNNWIDESDAIYESLRIWTRDKSGESQLIALGKAEIGAIYLGHIETGFSIKNDQNALLGQVRETGLAVKESGQVVSVQQLDLLA